MDLISGKEYTQSELPSDIFNITDGSSINYGGKNYVGKVNPNGTRSFSVNAGAAYDDLLSKTPKIADYAKGLNANENAAWDQYMQYIQGQQSPLQFYQQMSEQAGIPQLRKTQSTLQGQIYDLEDTLRRIEPDVTANTGNSIVTEAQRRGMVTERQKPVMENLGWQSQSLGRVSNAITEGNQQILNLTQLNMQGQDRFIDAYKEKLNLAVQQGNRGLQAYIQDVNNTLDITLKKIARGETLADQEAQRAFELLKLRQSAEIEASKPSTEVVEADGRKYLIDKITGKRIADLGSSKTAKSGGGTVNGVADYYGDSTDDEWEIVPQYNSILEYNNWASKQK